ncbi:MAG TPA: hypothetical protein VFS30_08040 [Dehalococcoidia bacterium]|nr:hypothetical protein [Dehalococcoidia bacterium]
MNDPANSSDEELAASLSDSDDQAIAALVDRHAQTLYDFALRLTLDTEAAAEIVSAAFDYLRANAAQRPDEMGLRPWLFNFILEQGLEAVNDRDRPATGKLSTGDRRFTQTDPGVDREAALWAWQAARSLRPRDYGVVDLTARRGLNPELLTGPATQGRGGIYTILSRASEGFAEAYVATALYFRGRDACGELSELVGGSAAAMRVGIRRQIVAHAEDCQNCQTTLDSLPNGSDVFSALHNVDPPADLTRQIVSAASAATLAAGQLSLDDAGAPSEATADEDEETAALEDAGMDEPGLEGDEPAIEQEETVAEEQAREEAPVDREASEPPANEEELWARPDGDEAFAGVAAADLPDAVSDIEERLGVEPPGPPYQPTEAYEQYSSEYAPEQPYYAGYAPAPLTLTERLSIWFEPAYGRSFLWSYALLGVSTAVAIYIGLAVAGSLSGGGGDALPAGATNVVREIACETGRMTMDAGGSKTFQFDPDALNGFELDRVVVAASPSAAAKDALVVEVAGATSLAAEAAPAYSPTARSNEYGVQILWQRGDEDAVTDCPLFVNVSATTGPSPAPATTETPEVEETPDAEATPTP